MTSTRCPLCGGPVVEIVLAADDKGLTMRSCSTCDALQWGAVGRSVDLSEVIDELSASGATRRHRRAT